jgi:hypothetical protein
MRAAWTRSNVSSPNSRRCDMSRRENRGQGLPCGFLHYSVQNLRTVHLHQWRCGNAETNLGARNRHDLDVDVVIHNDHFANKASENEHGLFSLNPRCRQKDACR